MARARNIKPGFFLNDELAEIEPLGRILFAGLWTIADREGRMEDRPKKIKASVLPYDNCDIDNLLNQLANKGFIFRYEVDGCKYIQIINFSKHQNPHKNEAPSSIPAPYLHSTSTVQVQEENTTNPADSLNLIPDSLNPINIDNDDDNARAREAQLEEAQRQIVNTYNQEMGRLISQNEAEQLTSFLDDGMDAEVVCEAVKRTRLNGKTSVKYAITILRNWRDEGVINMVGVERADIEFEKRKQQKGNKTSIRSPDKRMPRGFAGLLELKKEANGHES
ncbi:DnaD domain-containing protein [Desulfotomaculum sp. 1211_IL3151]|uniref:DnaD domain-containing protein n=1 Tax=Desulfotomaculum sp. 1211_IL3151 TaxID=3084055 RepID=UPI002FDA15F4